MNKKLYRNKKFKKNAKKLSYRNFWKNIYRMQEVWREKLVTSIFI